jgi:hypothetical protein
VRGGRFRIIIAAIFCIVIACAASQNGVSRSALDIALGRMLVDDPGLSSERVYALNETSPLFYYGTLLTVMRTSPTKDQILDAARIDSELWNSFSSAPIERRSDRRITMISAKDRRQHWNDWLIEASPQVKNIYAPTDERGVFVRGALGGGQSGVYYWIGFSANGRQQRIVRLDVSESP